MTPNAKLARALADAMSIEARIIHGQPMPGDYSKLSTLAHEIGQQAQKSVFASEKEAYDFCRNLYKDSGGVTPELRRAFEFYQQNLSDDCRPEAGLNPNQHHAG